MTESLLDLVRRERKRRASPDCFMILVGTPPNEAHIAEQIAAGKASGRVGPRAEIVHMVLRSLDPRRIA